jgi:stage III sporulation protein AH
MQSKRQAIWLVTMLGLMMGISVFYLVTDPVNPWDGAEEWMSSGALQEQEVAQIQMKQTSPPSASHQPVSTTQPVQRDRLIGMHQQKQEMLSNETEKHMQIINDASADASAMNQAYEAVAKLEDSNEKMTVIEEKLSAKYHDAVVMEERDRWKVFVPVDQLSAKQASEIVQLVMNEMNVGPSRVMIQMIP